MKRLLATLALAVVCAGAFTAHAIDAVEGFDDPKLQARYDKLTSELRCLVCQSGSIAESNALLAADLRREVRSMLAAGKTDDEIRRFMTDRYGDFVLYRPPFAPRTWLLWFGPALFLLLGGFVAFRVVSRRAAMVASDADDPGAPDAMIEGEQVDRPRRTRAP